MPTLSFAEALRYLLVGFVGFLGLLVANPQLAEDLLERVGALGIAAAALAAGALAYVLYRPLIYDSLIVPLQDWVEPVRVG